MPKVLAMIDRSSGVEKTTWKKNSKEQIFFCKTTDTSMLKKKLEVKDGKRK